MNTLKKNIITAVLTALMITLLTACGGSTPETASAPKDSETTASAQESEKDTSDDTLTKEEKEYPDESDDDDPDRGAWFLGGLVTHEDGVNIRVALYRVDGEPDVIVNDGDEWYYGAYETEDAKTDDGLEYSLLTVNDVKYGYHFNADNSGIIVDKNGNVHKAAALDEGTAMEMMDSTGYDAEGSESYSFVEDQSGITSFKDYDDIISHLKSGQGYAYIKLYGLDDDILAVTDSLFDDDSSDVADLYCMSKGSPEYMGVVSGYGHEYPLRFADGILYAGNAHDYESYFISSEYKSLMMKDSVSDANDDGKVVYIGFTRDTNDFDHDKDFTGGEKEFNDLLKTREKAPMIVFTKIP